MKRNRPRHADDLLPRAGSAPDSTAGDGRRLKIKRRVRRRRRPSQQRHRASCRFQQTPDRRTYRLRGLLPAAAAARPPKPVEILADHQFSSGGTSDGVCVSRWRRPAADRQGCLQLPASAEAARLDSARSSCSGQRLSRAGRCQRRTATNPPMRFRYKVCAHFRVEALRAFARQHQPGRPQRRRPAALGEAARVCQLALAEPALAPPRSLRAGNTACSDWHSALSPHPAYRPASPGVAAESWRPQHAQHATCRHGGNPRFRLSDKALGLLCSRSRWHRPCRRAQPVHLLADGAVSLAG